MQIILKNRINGHVNRENIPKVRHLLKEEYSEKSLWKAVICQAIEDATTKSAKERKLLAKHRAIKWLTEDNEDFKAVCDLAGYSHKTVRKNILDIVETSEKETIGDS